MMSELERSITNQNLTDLFDLNCVHDNFNASLIDNDDIDLKSYLNAYKELQKFFHLMGTVFGFVGSEIGSKMEILEQFVFKDKENNYSTMKQMVQFEMDSGLLNDTSFVSGSRTLLRLHRGLDFLRQFLKSVGDLAPQDETNTCAKDVYNQTLAKYHSWLIRKGAVLAMYMLPTRDVLLHRVCGENTELTLEALPDMLKSTNEVYNRTEQLFQEKDLLNLP